MNNFLKPILDFLKPSDPKWDRWQTLIWMSIFSWAVSLLTDGLVQEMIATGAWIFLIAGVHWFLYTEKKKLTFDLIFADNFFIGPWITGALISLYLFGHLFQYLPSLAFIAWPPISTALAVMPRFIKIGPEYVIPEPKFRQEIVILMLANLLISCWIQLYFATLDWIRDYPSLMADDLGRSAFVIKLTPQEKLQSRGIEILNQAEKSVQTELTKLAWGQVERWLFDVKQQVPGLRSSVMQQIPALPENSYWNLDARLVPGEYAVELIATWRGPTADADGYHFKKICRINQVPDKVSVTPQPTVTSNIAASRAKALVQCDRVVGPIPGAPPPPAKR